MNSIFGWFICRPIVIQLSLKLWILIFLIFLKYHLRNVIYGGLPCIMEHALRVEIIPKEWGAHLLIAYFIYLLESYELKLYIDG